MFAGTTSYHGIILTTVLHEMRFYENYMVLKQGKFHIMAWKKHVSF